MQTISDVVFIMLGNALFKVALTLSLWIKFGSATNQMKALSSSSGAVYSAVQCDFNFCVCG